MQFENIHQTIDHLFRHESGKMVAVLSRLLGLQNLETAQDIVQDTLLQAMSTWSYNGIPENPPAWLYRVAKNKAIDFLRREKKLKAISTAHGHLLDSEYTLAPTVNQLFLDDEIQDSQLRMIFACCHPSIPEESQIALTLKTLCGLTVAEIAKAFLVSDETIAKRIYRAREKIRQENIGLLVPQGAELRARLDVVLRSLYLVFNEGYKSSHPDELIREDLCEDAMRLVYLLTQHNITNRPEANAVLSLMCFQASRLPARTDDQGNIILLKYQDRSKWFRPLIEKGFFYLDLATENLASSPYHVEAAISSLHASARSFEETDWKSIHQLYEILYQMQPSAIVQLNKAIALAFAGEKQKALQDLRKINGLERYHIYYTSLGEICFDLDDRLAARNYFETALTLTTSRSEQQFLRSKIESCR